MPPMTQPPMAPDVQAQMGPGPGFGALAGQAQAQAGKSPIEMAVATVEKMLTGIQDEAFRPFAMKAIATLKVGLAQVNSKQPQSAGMGAPPPPGGGGPPQIPTPPIPGQMPA
jgi:hypothetical protein